MDTLCLLQSGIPGIVPLITSITATTTTTSSRANDQVHVHQSHVTTVRRSNKSTMFSRFIGNSARNNCLAVDDAVTAENVERVVKEGDGPNGNWVFKVFDLNSIWKEEKKSDNDEEECDVCRVDEEVDEEDDENEEIRFDRESFSRMLRRVTLVEARMYAHMSHLGNLAYSIPNIKVYFLLHFLLCFHGLSALSIYI